jgi:hypothetical protein
MDKLPPFPAAWHYQSRQESLNKLPPLDISAGFSNIEGAY